MMDFKARKKEMLGEIRSLVEPILALVGFRYESNNTWSKDVGWALYLVSLGARRLTHGLYCDLIGGAGIFMERDHQILQPDYLSYVRNSIPPMTIGGPISWMDERLELSDGQFTSMEEFQTCLSKYASVIKERVVGEFERFPDENSLLKALIRPDWVSYIRFAPDPDRRGGLVALMLARRDGALLALDWIHAEYERLRNRDVQKRPLKYWREIWKASQFLQALSISGKNEANL